MNGAVSLSISPGAVPSAVSKAPGQSKIDGTFATLVDADANGLSADPSDTVTAGPIQTVARPADANSKMGSTRNNHRDDTNDAPDQSARSGDQINPPEPAMPRRIDDNGSAPRMGKPMLDDTVAPPVVNRGCALPVITDEAAGLEHSPSAPITSPLPKVLSKFTPATHQDADVSAPLPTAPSACAQPRAQPPPHAAPFAPLTATTDGAGPPERKLGDRGADASQTAIDVAQPPPEYPTVLSASVRGLERPAAGSSMSSRADRTAARVRHVGNTRAAETDQSDPAATPTLGNADVVPANIMPTPPAITGLATSMPATMKSDTPDDLTAGLALVSARVETVPQTPTGADQNSDAAAMQRAAIHLLGPIALPATTASGPGSDQPQPRLFDSADALPRMHQVAISAHVATSDSAAVPTARATASSPRDVAPREIAVPLMPDPTVADLSATGLVSSASPVPQVPASPARADAAPTTPAQQVSDATLTLVKSPSAAPQLLLHLHPADLGSVQIRIDQSELKGTHIEIVVEKPETLDILQRDQVQLHQTLDAAGVQASGRDVTFHLAAATPNMTQPGTVSDGLGAGGSQSPFDNTGAGHGHKGGHNGQPSSGQEPIAPVDRAETQPLAAGAGKIHYRIGLNITA